MLKEGNYYHYGYQKKCQESSGKPKHRRFNASYCKNAFSHKSDYVDRSQHFAVINNILSHREVKVT